MCDYHIVYSIYIKIDMRINLYTSYIYINYKWISVCYHQCVIMTNRLSETNTLFFIVIIDDHYFAKNEK